MSDLFNPYASLYEIPKGPGDARPTALRVLEDNDALGKWQGRVALVTGSTSGIGYETARALHATGADVYLTARDMQKGLDAAERIRSSSPGSGKLDVLLMDMDSLESVKAAAHTFLSRSDKLNILVNNAGIMGTPQSKTADGFERQFGVNHLAHFALTGLLLSTMVKSSTQDFQSRVVCLTSAAHRYSSIVFDDFNLAAPGAYEPYRAYGQSKTANIWTANYINRVFGPHGVHGLAVHPGAIWSGLYSNAEPAMLDEWSRNADLMSQMQSPEQGAATTIWAATGRVWEGRGGKYLANCAVGSLTTNTTAILSTGFGPHAFDVEGENRLWELSEKLTGVSPSRLIST